MKKWIAISSKKTTPVRNKLMECNQYFFDMPNFFRHVKLPFSESPQTGFFPSPADQTVTPSSFGHIMADF
jgi:hypothetical protein